ncbi:hypothetical protein SNE40_000672 [Patella caerulea]|uniref:PiggyBac transposable element-derived protein domain-containing protein n=1 Tax=Patella caerulea TaxID=87958 RepID=A0AAN8KLV0_PATCE
MIVEHSLTKPRYEDYFSKEATNFVTFTPGFRDVFTCDRFLAIWKFIHIVDEENEDIDKSDKIYKVRYMLDDLLKKFQKYWNPKQYLSLDEGMIPAKNRCFIKQYIKIKQIKWGIKSFLLCESESGYLMNAEIYTEKNEGFYSADLGSTGSVVVRLCSGFELNKKKHIIVMDRFYTSTKLFEYMYREMEMHAVGTTIMNRKFFPDELKETKRHKKTMNRGD